MGEYRQFKIQANVTRSTAELHKRFLADVSLNGCDEDCTDMYNGWSEDSKWTGGWDVIQKLSKRFPSTIFLCTIRGRYDSGTHFVLNGRWVDYDYVYPKLPVPTTKLFETGMKRKLRAQAKRKRDQKAAERKRKREELERKREELARLEREVRKAS